MNRQFASPGPVNADIRVTSGTLHITASAGDQINVSIEPLDNSQASQEAAEQTRVQLDGKHLVVHTPNGKGWQFFRWPKLRVVIELPADSVLNLKAASADVTCNGVFHDVVANTASGDLFLDRITKDLSINSASGDTKIGWVGGDLRVHSASGDLMAQHIGRAADIVAASGDVEIGRADGDVRAKTASGDITIGSARAGEVRLHTASGDLSVGVAAGTGVWLDVNTSSGRTTSDLFMNDNGQAPAGAQTNLTIKARTASGDITLHRVPAVV